MARIWKEKRKRVVGWIPSHRMLDPQLVHCPMVGNAPPAEFSPDPTIIPEWVYCVYVCGFTFRFWSIKQLQACLDFYSQKLHPSSRIQVTEEMLYHIPDRSMLQRWYDRLPLYLRKKSKRQQVVKALEKALKQFGDEPSLLTSMPKTTIHLERTLVGWCFKCDKLLGQGRCLKCKRKRSSPGYRVAHCNHCDSPLGQGDCRGCQSLREKLQSDEYR
ncbi:hypothetical protein [Leptothoe sp. PORK10 BA2]|uniref:hypothetical protein n=1 Tax=Leptothoe sp. PORK10 BA2 TaxID=3110254 RepID=UPI002B221734|nr:hypothetical protein [Leptothoe sp. PORK10 BA2]MEA5467045.1 hypothetical protein [Leptothoe sp. PORK10 BA2]